MNLLTYRNLWMWLDAPFRVPVLDLLFSINYLGQHEGQPHNEIRSQLVQNA
jgi:hypothetical protein